jgi:hypothetical protein
MKGYLTNVNDPAAPESFESFETHVDIEIEITFNQNKRMLFKIEN